MDVNTLWTSTNAGRALARARTTQGNPVWNVTLDALWHKTICHSKCPMTSIFPRGLQDCFKSARARATTGERPEVSAGRGNNRSHGFRTQQLVRQSHAGRSPPPPKQLAHLEREESSATRQFRLL